jgi:hypothetical protein
MRFAEGVAGKSSSVSDSNAGRLYQQKATQNERNFLATGLRGISRDRHLEEKSSDVDFESLELNVTRSILLQRIAPPKLRHRRNPPHSILNWPTFCSCGARGRHIRGTTTGHRQPSEQGRVRTVPSRSFACIVRPALKAAEITETTVSSR